MKKTTLAGGILFLAVLSFSILLTVRHMEPKLTRNQDQEFASGTQIRIETVNDTQQASLYKLCKVWGYVKYHHPSVIDGALNWDNELFRVLPEVVAAGSSARTNGVLTNWLNQFPFETPAADGAVADVAAADVVASDVAAPDEGAAAWEAFQQAQGGFSLDTSWILDRQELGSSLSSYLEQLSCLRIYEREHAYAAFDNKTPYVNFDQEQNRSCAPEDDGVKLLSLFRFWNLYEYYSPNVSITVKDWDTVLWESIPRVLAADTYRDYVLAMAETAALTGDAHISIFELEHVLENYYGTYSLPCSFKTVDGQVVVSGTPEENGQMAGSGTPEDSNQAAGFGTPEDSQLEDRLLPGDIILEVDGMTIADRIAELSRYTALSEPDKYAVHFQNRLLKTRNDQAQVTILRNGTTKQLQVHTLSTPYQFQNPYHNGLMEEGQIGYIDPSTLKTGDLERLMKSFADTKGIIVDLRYYPSVFLPYLLGEYITPEPVPFARMSFPNRMLPGTFYYSDDFYTGAGAVEKMTGKKGKTYPPYHGKVVLLMDETSMSQSEFTIMALRQSPNAVVVGSPSIGADGNVVRILLPGGLKLSISGLGIYTPDGEETQRVGLTPDIPCKSTVEGLRERRDELIEKAIEIITS